MTVVYEKNEDDESVPMPNHYYWAQRDPRNSLARIRCGYHWRGHDYKDSSDYTFIITCLSQLPASQRENVAQSYSSVFINAYNAEPNPLKQLHQARVSANTRLRIAVLVNQFFSSVDDDIREQALDFYSDALHQLHDQQLAFNELRKEFIDAFRKMDL